MQLTELKCYGLKWRCEVFLGTYCVLNTSLRAYKSSKHTTIEISIAMVIPIATWLKQGRNLLVNLRSWYSMYTGSKMYIAQTTKSTDSSSWSQKVLPACIYYWFQNVLDKCKQFSSQMSTWWLLWVQKVMLHVTTCSLPRNPPSALRSSLFIVSPISHKSFQEKP